MLHIAARFALTAPGSFEAPHLAMVARGPVNFKKNLERFVDQFQTVNTS